MSIKQKSIAFLCNTNVLLALLLLLTIIITIQNLLLGVNDLWGGNHTHYNNYVIFKYSFFHLLDNRNMYDYYSAEYADLYKYSPTFAMAMGVLSWTPDPIGLFLWNAINVLVLFYGLKGMKFMNTPKQLPLMLLFLVFELILTIQNSQSNELLAGLTIMAYNQFEKNNTIWASLLIVVGVYIKIYSVLGALLLFLYPKKVRSILYMVAWGLLLFVLPLAVVSPGELFAQYQNWLVMLKADQSASIGMSAYIFTQHLLPEGSFKIVTLILGVILLLLPLAFYHKASSMRFRTEYLALILLWMVIFNYKAESPTFIITMCGVAIWYFVTDKNMLKKALFFLSLAFTSLWFTDLVPRDLKNSIIDVNYIKPFFPMLVLLFISYELIVKKYATENTLEQ